MPDRTEFDRLTRAVIESDALAPISVPTAADPYEELVTIAAHNVDLFSSLRSQVQSAETLAVHVEEVARNAARKAHTVESKNVQRLVLIRFSRVWMALVLVGIAAGVLAGAAVFGGVGLDPFSAMFGVGATLVTAGAVLSAARRQPLE